MAEFKFYLDRRVGKWQRYKYTIEADNFEDAQTIAREGIYNANFPPEPEDISDVNVEELMNFNVIDQIQSTKELIYKDEVGFETTILGDHRPIAKAVPTPIKKEEIIVKIIDGEIKCSDPRVKIVDLDDEGISDEEDIEKAKEFQEKTKLSRREQRKLDRKLEREAKAAKVKEERNSLYDAYMGNTLYSYGTTGVKVNPFNLEP